MFCCVYIYIHTFIYLCIVIYIYIHIEIYLHFHIHTYLDVYIYIEYDFIHTVHPNSWLIHFGTSPWIGLHRARQRYNCAARNAFPDKKCKEVNSKGKVYQQIPPIFIYIYMYIRVSTKWLFWGQYGVLFWEQLLGYLFKDTQIFPLMNVFWCGEKRSLNLSWTKDRCFAASMWNTSHGKVPYMQRKKRSSLGILMPLKTIWANFVPKSSYSWKRFGHFGGKKTPILTSVRLFENHTPCFWNCIDLPSSGQNGQKNISMGYRFLGGSSDLVGS